MGEKGTAKMCMKSKQWQFWRSWALGLAASAFCGSFSLSSQASVMHGLSSTTTGINTSAPTGYEEAWLRTGSLGGGSGVYLGNGYVLTAAHVNSTSGFTVNGVSHLAIAGSREDLTNNGESGFTNLTDLMIFRIMVPDSSPLHGLGALAISQSSLAGTNTQGVMIGEGRGQTTTAPVNLGAGAQGYLWGNSGSRAKRWAEVLVSNPANFGVSTNGRDVMGMVSFAFQQQTGRGNATVGDSGGGLFVLNDGEVELTGAIHSVTSITGQAASSSAFGNQTLFSDLSIYTNQINIYEGDLDGDGHVGDLDLALVLGNWGQSVVAGDWLAGDASGDGHIGESDLSYVLDNWGAGSAPVAQNVPTPSTGVIFGLLGMCFLRRRRKDNEN